MELKVLRYKLAKTYTLGKLFIDNKFQCYTLEDAVRKKKIPNETAIPEGRYKIIIDWSSKFKKLLPRLLNVPEFLGVRIHSGNNDKHTQGCILVGDTVGEGWIGESRLAFDVVFDKIKTAINKKEQVYIEVKNDLA